MSEPDRPARPTPDDLSPGADPGARPLAEALSALGTGELLKRLDEHRARVPRHSGRQHLASGGMGEVHRVRDEDLGRDLAMKVLRRDFEALDEEDRQRMLARFLEEAQVTGQLHHPAIVPVYELSIDAQGQPYFTMPLIRGRDFGEVIRLVREGRDGWTLARALGIVLKVCEAVAYAHARGVIHRDLKPSNVRVGRFGETYVMDWGLARVLGRADARDLRLRDPALSRSSAVRTERSKLKTEEPDSPLITMDGQVVGTPQFMSPEQARGETARIGPRSDVYAVGALLYHLLSGRAPYQPAEGVLSARAVWSLVLDGPPRDLAELAPDAPEELVDICRKAMERIPEKRYADTQEMALDIEAFLDRRPVKAHAPTVGYALKLAYERNRRSVGIVCAAALVIIAVSVWQWMNIRTARAAEQASTQERMDLFESQFLRQEVDRLWPAGPAKQIQLGTWLESAQSLMNRKGLYEAKLGSLPERSADLGSMQVHQLLEDLGFLQRTWPQMVVREELARTLESRSRQSVASAKRWRDAIESIASLPAYGGLRIRPQLGLLPLWQNEASGLWEFWVLDSGSIPELPAHWDSPVPREQDGIVLVLVPAQDREIGSPEGEAGREGAKELQHRVLLSAYFLSKYETTQAQWSTIMGTNPARYCPEETSCGPTSLLRPVESVSWIECTEFCRRVGLRLPFEREWECAARAGQDHPYTSGDSLESLENSENILDMDGQSKASAPPAAWHDGFMTTAPVGSFRPNAYGVHDMGGNVAEWCADIYDESEVAQFDGSARPHECIQPRSFRGGCWYLPPQLGRTFPLRVAYRQYDNPKGANHFRGLRPARALE